jgi:hypothetical protein
MRQWPKKARYSMGKFIEVVESETGKVVRTIDVTGKGETHIEKTERGMLINMDRDRFFTRVVSK